MPNGPPDPMNKVAPEVALTVRELVLQVSNQVSSLQRDLDMFKTTVVTKNELDLFRETQKSARRWAIGIICSIIGASSSGVMVVVSLA